MIQPEDENLPVTQQLSGDMIDPDASRLVAILDRYLADLKSGMPPDREALLAHHPELAEQLQACLAGLEFIHAAGSSADAIPTLGDFQIIREVGRGGMGAVYEATQLSLSRRVALKILRFGGVSDTDAVKRFTREAEMVAHLHHTNIVPIFAVGSEQGVNYYAMQFIEGQSLDQVLRERTERGETISPETVAEWGLQAAEALTHAHARGVIHRDVKPSNLLIDDEEGRIWLTDFGLAKRLDDVTLSMTGALLGTPRYMSPEQATATNSKLDHRTDIYSLGATLYELVTGQPVFQGSTPHDVISQIISSEPTSARSHRASLPRDLDTIMMKCLSKDAAQRYASARDLVDDMRAFLEGRPIAARRISTWERTTRWVKRQRRSVGLAGATVAATALLILTTALAGYAWHRSQLASLMLKSDRPPLVAELLQNGQRVLPPITVPTQHQIEIPSGRYDLRMSSDGRLSQTIDATFKPGEAAVRQVSLEDQLLWKDVSITGDYELVKRRKSKQTLEGSIGKLKPGSTNEGQPEAYDGQSDIVEFTDEGINCLSGQGHRLWSLNLVEPSHGLLKQYRHLKWPWVKYFGGPSAVGVFDSRPWLVSNPEYDLDGDGLTDILLTARHQAWTMAINGRDGSPLWVVDRASAKTPELDSFNSVESAVVQPPQFVDDQDGDGVIDLLVMFIDKPDRQQTDRWIELVSGATGSSIWRFDLESKWFELAVGEEIPVALRWFFGSSGGGSAGGGFMSQFYYRIRDPARVHRSGESEYLPTAMRVMATSDLSDKSRQKRIAFICGKHFFQLDLGTGKPLAKSPLEVSVRPALEPRYGDFDGDGEVDLLLVESLPERMSTVPGSSFTTPHQRFDAWSPSKSSILWHYDIEVSLPQQAAMNMPVPDWPQVVDLDGDGKCEVITAEKAISQGAFAPPWGQVVVLDGESGQTRWTRRSYNVDRQLEWFVAGPDIDGDNVREVYVASQWGLNFDLYVDCLSGKDGRLLWHLNQPLLVSDNETGEFRLAGLKWYETGGDGWPQLIVQAVQCENNSASDRAVFVSAGTGAMNHFALDVSRVDIGNLDADEIEDLVILQRSDSKKSSAGGRLHAFRGVTIERWKKWIEPQIVVGDLDGDGVGDLVPNEVHRELVVHSGATGEVIWQKKFDYSRRRSTAYSPTIRSFGHSLLDQPLDLNGDDVPDIILGPHRHDVVNRTTRGPLLTALSGRNGAPIWESEFQSYYIGQIAMLEFRDLNGDGQPEIIAVVPSDFGQPVFATNRQSIAGGWHNAPQLWIAVLSAHNGKTLWTKPLCDVQPFANPNNFRLDQMWLEAAWGDLNQDGTLDIILPAQRAPASELLELQAISGRDGQVLWKFPISKFEQSGEAFCNVIPASVGDLDGDGKNEVVVLAFESPGNNWTSVQKLTMTVLRGTDGFELWNWKTMATRHLNEVLNNFTRVKNRLRPQIVRRSDGTSWVAICVREGALEIFVLNHQGDLVSQKKLDSMDAVNEENSLWVMDAEDDGQDELLFFEPARLSLLSADELNQPIWTRPTSRSALTKVVGLIADDSAVGRLVVTGGNGDFSLCGFNLASGQTEWLVPGPSAEHRTQAPGIEAALLLNVPTEAVPAQGLFQFEGPTLIRQSTSRINGINPSDRQIAVRATPITNPVGVDFRLRRPLPWKPADWELDAIGQALFWAVFYGLTLSVMPILYLSLLVHNRRWGLKTLLALPVVVAIIITAAMIQPQDPNFKPFDLKLICGIGALPITLTLITFIRWWMQGRWRLAIGWTIAAMLISIGYGAVLLLVIEPGRSARFLPGERYDWGGWYYGLSATLYGTCLLVTLAVVGAWTGKTVWKFWGRIFVGPRHANEPLGR